MKTTIIILILLFLFTGIQNASSEIIVYDNITADQYKTITQSSDLCLGLGLTDCTNEMYVDSFHVQDYKDNELVQYPDNSNITLVLNDPINSNLQNIYTSGKTKFQVGIMYFVGVIVIIIILLLVVFAIKGLSRKKGWF
jgi:uncharacterized lipoprotein YajG